MGRVIYDFVDQSRIDPFASDRTEDRELSVFVWYPSSPSSGASPGPYLPAAWQQAFARQPSLADRLNSLAATPATNVHSHSFDNAPLSSAAQKHPLLIFSTGLGLAAYEYSSTLEDLASHGYVVAGVNPTYRTKVVLSGGRLVHAVNPAADNADIPSLVELWAQDLRFVAQQLGLLNTQSGDRFANRLQMTRIGYFGHSIGVAAATSACQREPACAGAADIDGDLAGDVLINGLGKPFTFLAHDDAFAEENHLRGQVHDVLKGVKAGDGYAFRVVGTRHLSFTDGALAFNIVFALLRANGSIDPRRAIRITSAYMAAFFQRYVLDQPSPLLAGSPVYPEVLSVPA